MVKVEAKGFSGNGPQFEAEAHIAFILEQPGISDWLKRALREALPRDPITVINDLEILNLVLRQRSEALVSSMIEADSRLTKFKDRPLGV